MTGLTDRHKARLVEALERPLWRGTWIATKVLAQDCALWPRETLKRLAELEAEGRVISTIRRGDNGRINRMWRLR